MKTYCLFVTLLLLTLLPVTRAQDVVFCGELPAADCDLLAANRAVMRDLESVTYDMSLTFSGFTETDHPFDLMLSSEGTAITGQDTLLATLRAMLDAMSVDVVLALAEPAFLAPTAEGQVRVAFPVEDSEQPAAFSAQMRLTGGHLYVTSLFLQFMVPGLERGQWLDLDLMNASTLSADLLRDPARMQALAETAWSRGLPLPGGDLSDGDLNGVPFAQVVQHFIQTGRTLNRELLADPDFQNRFLSIQRLDDQTLEDRTVAVFETTLNYAALVEADVFQQAMSDTLTLMASHDMSPQEIEQVRPLLLQMLASQETTITRTISLDDHYTDSVTITWSVILDPAITPADTPRTVTVTYEQRLSDHNQPVTVEAPEDTLPMIDLMQSLMGNG